MQNRGILFDFDGVIVNSEEHHRLALTAMLDDYGIALGRAAYYRDFLGLEDRECVRQAFAGAGRAVDTPDLARAIATKIVHYERALGSEVALVPGAADFIQSASNAGVRCGLVSGARRREIDVVLARTNLASCFQVVVAAEDVTQCKPSPEGYGMGLRGLGLTAERCVAIEDSFPGFRAARGARLSCLMLTTSHPASELHEAELVWDSFAGHAIADLPWAPETAGQVK
ncbi:MAG: HAD family phosphatase [Gemmatimonadota bacterium]